MMHGSLMTMASNYNDNAYRMQDIRDRVARAVDESKRISEVWLTMAPHVKHRMSRLRVKHALNSAPDIELFLNSAPTSKQTDQQTDQLLDQQVNQAESFLDTPSEAGYRGRVTKD